MGENYDHLVCEWRDLNARRLSNTAENLQTSSEFQHVRGYVLVGDNIDKRVNPQEMRIDSQVLSLHYFHSYAAKNRCITALNNSTPIGDILTLPMSVFLPTQEECMVVRNNYVILVSRIIVEHLPSFSMCKKCVPNHIPHKYTHAMSEKSLMVS